MSTAHVQAPEGMFRVMFGIRRVLAGAVLVATLASFACGEGTQPDREAVQVEISRPGVTVEIGDTVVLRAEARDVNGDPIASAPLAWATLDAGFVPCNQAL